MNDTELDEMLDQWAAPPAPASLREKVRVGFEAQIVSAGAPMGWRSALLPGMRETLLAAAVAGVGVFLFMVTGALSQTAPVVGSSPRLGGCREKARSPRRQRISGQLAPVAGRR